MNWSEASSDEVGNQIMSSMDKKDFNVRRALAVSCIAISQLVLVSYAPAARADHPYFDWLNTLSQVHLSRAYRSDAEITPEVNAVNPNNRIVPPFYDSQMDAARFTVQPGWSGIAVQDQLRPEFPRVTSGNLMFTWDVRWDPAFQANLGGIQTHKAFQMASSTTNDERRLELRTRFNFVSAPDLAELDIRRYNFGFSGDDTPPTDVRFILQPDRWTRFWTLVDFTTNQFSLWVADEQRQPVLVVDRLQFTNFNGGLDQFWYEFNSSQSRSGGASLAIWTRNLVILRDVADPDTIVSQGALVAAANGDSPRPPVLLAQQAYSFLQALQANLPAQQYRVFAIGG